MQPSRRSYSFPFLCLAALLSAASGLIVEPVRLVNNRTHISYGLNASANNSLLECNYHLDDREQVQRVLWEMWDEVDKLGTYEWRPDSGGKATGRLEGVVNLNREDGALELTKLRYNLAGRYSCSVGLTNGFMKNTSKEEVIIIDITGIGLNDNSNQKCSSVSSFRSQTIFPEPTVHAGLFSKKLNKFYKEVPSQAWSKVIHLNGSVTYSYTNVSFKIDKNAPDDIVFKTTEGVTKSDGEYISLIISTSYGPDWNVRGCHDVMEEDNKKVYYSSVYSATCRGGRVDKTTATVTCKEGYEAQRGVSKVVMRCNGTTLTWQPDQGHTATVGDLDCGVIRHPVAKGGASSGNPSLILHLGSLFGIVLLFNFSHL